jgi:hypothetical protein
MKFSIYEDRMAKKKDKLKELLEIYGSMPHIYDDPECNLDLGDWEHHKRHHEEIEELKDWLKAILNNKNWEFNGDPYKNDFIWIGDDDLIINARKFLEGK